MEKALCFDDVLLVPQYSEISRNDVDLSTDLGKGIKLNLPLISAPMDTVTEAKMAEAMSKSGACGILHRYKSEVDYTYMVEATYWAVDQAEVPIFGFAVGVSKADTATAKRFFGNVERFRKEKDARVICFICMDVAHAHHLFVREAIERLRSELGDNVFIMAGNVATAGAYEDLTAWGADAVKVSIGGGSICSTRIQTGHGMPTLQAVFDCANRRRNWHPKGAAIIADGGVRNSGDIVKAIAAGADAVMAGSLFAGTDETPGNVHIHNSKKLKDYRGMASADAQMNWRGYTSSLEGVSTMVPYKGPVTKILEELRGGMVSGFSYSGARNIKELQKVAKWRYQTTSGTRESRPHIL